LKEGRVSSGISLALLKGSNLLLDALSLSAKSDRGNKTLDLGALGILLSTLLGELTSNNILANIISLSQVEELADLGSTLRTKALRDDRVSQTLNLVITLLDDNKVENRQIRAYDAATNGLALSLTSAASTVARKSVAKKKANTSVGENTLLHSKTLLVITTSDLEDLIKEGFDEQKLVKPTLMTSFDKYNK
jgi:hypothetical protein